VPVKRVIRKISSLLRKIRRKLFSPKVLRRLESQGLVDPRLRSKVLREAEGIPTVFRFSCDKNMEMVKEPLKTLLAGRYLDLIEGKKILIKFNLNTANPYPASVSPQMLRLLADVLDELGAGSIIAGDSCTVSLLPTKNQVRKAGLQEALSGRAGIICFDDLAWATVEVDGAHLKRVTIPRVVQEVDTIIALANIKTHMHALYTGALKLAVGFMHPLERGELHRNHIQEKIAELNLAVQPDLCVMDGRTVMISGGPDHGDTASGNCLIVGDNPLAADLEAYKLLQGLQVSEGVENMLGEDPFSLLQFSHARDIGVGGLPWKGYNLEEVYTGS